MSTDTSVVFVAQERLTPGVVVFVNFELVTGREATLAEIDRLAETLLETLDHISIVSQIRHEIGTHTEVRVHQVVIEVDAARLPAEAAACAEVERRLAEIAEAWVRDCAADRAVAP